MIPTSAAPCDSPAVRKRRLTRVPRAPSSARRATAEPARERRRRLRDEHRSPRHRAQPACARAAQETASLRERRPRSNAAAPARRVGRQQRELRGCPDHPDRRRVHVTSATGTTSSAQAAAPNAWPRGPRASEVARRDDDRAAPLRRAASATARAAPPAPRIATRAPRSATPCCASAASIARDVGVAGDQRRRPRG